MTRAVDNTCFVLVRFEKLLLFGYVHVHGHLIACTEHIKIFADLPTVACLSTATYIFYTIAKVFS